MYVEGSYFGDLEVLLKRYRRQGRDGTAIVDSECHLLVIGSKELKNILKYFKEVEQQMINTAKKRRTHHQKSIEEAKKRASEKNLKPIRISNLIQSQHQSLNKITSWKKGKKDINLIAIAKEYRKKLEQIAQRGNQQDLDESLNQQSLSKSQLQVKIISGSSDFEDTDGDSEDDIDEDKTEVAKPSPSRASFENSG